MDEYERKHVQGRGAVSFRDKVPKNRQFTIPVRDELGMDPPNQPQQPVAMEKGVVCLERRGWVRVQYIEYLNNHNVPFIKRKLPKRFLKVETRTYPDHMHYRDAGESPRDYRLRKGWDAPTESAALAHGALSEYQPPKDDDDPGSSV